MSRELVNEELAASLPKLPDGYRWKVTPATLSDVLIVIQKHKPALFGYRWKTIKEIGICGGLITELDQMDAVALILMQEFSQYLRGKTSGLYGVTDV
jgi:hypothetical protein